MPSGPILPHPLQAAVTITQELHQQTAEWLAVTFSRSVLPDSCDPMDGGRQSPLSKGFSRREYWSGLPCPPPDSRCRDGSSISCIAGGLFTAEPAGKPPQSGWGGSSKELAKTESPHFLSPPFLSLPSLAPSFPPSALDLGLEGTTLSPSAATDTVGASLHFASLPGASSVSTCSVTGVGCA